MMTKTWLSILFVSGIVQAALPPQKSVAPQPSTFQTVQRQIGGQAGSGFTLLGMQKVQSKDGKIERLVFEVGTKEGQPLKGLPGYFNAQNQVKPNRITIDFSQMMVSKVDERFVRGILKDSRFVKGVKVTEDPLDKTLSMTLDLNSEVKMRTMQIAGKKQTAKVVLDIIRR